VAAPARRAARPRDASAALSREADHAARVQPVISINSPTGGSSMQSRAIAFACVRQLTSKSRSRRWIMITARSGITRAGDGRHPVLGLSSEMPLITGRKPHRPALFFDHSKGVSGEPLLRTSLCRRQLMAEMPDSGASKASCRRSHYLAFKGAAVPVRYRRPMLVKPVRVAR
jgi:hypothetical protein